MSVEKIKLTKRDIEILEKVRVDSERNRALKESVPGILDTEIQLTDEDLDEFLKTFAETEWGQVMRKNVEAGSPCEARHDPQKPFERCGNPSVGSIDFYGSSFSDAVIVCREDVRFVYASIMSEDMHQDNLKPVLTINGKEIPRIPQVERLD